VPILIKPDVVVVYKKISLVISLGSGSIYFVFKLTILEFVLFNVAACNVVMLPPTDAILEQFIDVLFAVDAFIVFIFEVDAFIVDAFIIVVSIPSGQYKDEFI